MTQARTARPARLVTACALAFVPSFAAPGIAQNTVMPGPPRTEWLAATTANEVWSSLRRDLDTLRPPQRVDYLRAVGTAFFDGRPQCLVGPERRRCVERHALLLTACAKDHASLVEWFAVASATFLVDGNDCAAAIAALDAVEAIVPGSTAFAFERLARRVDCLVELQRLGAADDACAAAAALQLTDLQRARVLAQRGSVNVTLGRLDLASRSLERAGDLVDRVAATTPSPPDDVFALQFDLLLRQLDLLTAREQPVAARSRIAAFLRRVEADHRTLLPDQRTALRMHQAAAAVLASQQDPSGLAAAIGQCDALLSTADLHPRYVELSVVWLAGLQLDAGRYAEARAALQRLDAQPLTRRGVWAVAPMVAELARRTHAERPVLEGHEAELRRVLHEMMDEWREVSWERESTGFLRLGTRLRVVGELLAVTTLLHGPARALDDVLELQRCTTASRARQASPSTLVELQQQLFSATHGALVFLPSWGDSHVFAVDRDHVVHALLPPTRLVRQQVAGLQRELQALDVADAAGTDVELAPLVAASRLLAGSLLPPSIRAAMQRWQHLTITGASLLQGLQFECLEWAPGMLLGQRFAVATTASLPLLVVLRRDLPPPCPPDRLPTQVFATLRPAEEFARRNRVVVGELAGDAWQHLLGALPAGSDRCFGDRATVQAWRDGCRDGRHVVTLLLSHGEPPVGDQPPALGLAVDPAHPGGTLTPAEITAMPQSGLVIVSACHSARGPVRMGDDDVAATLAGAFLFAGASAVIATSVPLRTSLHLEVDAELLAALQAGATPAEALRRARLAVADGDVAAAYRVGEIGLVGWGASPLTSAPPRGPWWPWLLALGAAFTGFRLVARSRARSGCRPDSGSP